jgi:hypothetical protein
MIITFAIYDFWGVFYEMTKMPLSATRAADTPKTLYNYNIGGLSHGCKKKIIFQKYSFFLHP